MFKKILLILSAFCVSVCFLGCSVAPVSTEKSFVSPQRLALPSENQTTSYNTLAPAYDVGYRSTYVYDTLSSVVVNTSLVRVYNSASSGTPVTTLASSSSCVLSYLNLSWGSVQTTSGVNEFITSLDLFADMTTQGLDVVDSYIASPSSSSGAGFKYRLTSNFSNTTSDSYGYATLGVGSLEDNSFDTFVSSLNRHWTVANNNTALTLRGSAIYSCLIPTVSISGVGYYAIPCVIEVVDNFDASRIKSYWVSTQNKFFGPGVTARNITLPFVTDDIDAYCFIRVDDDNYGSCYIYFPYSTTGASALPESLTHSYSLYYVDSILNGNDAYSQGYSDGFNNGSYIGYNDGFATGKTEGAGEGYARGERDGYNNGYTAGVASANDYSFLGLIGAVFDAPIAAFRGLLNFEVLGVNLSSFALSLLTFAIVIKLVGLVLGNG